MAKDVEQHAVLDMVAEDDNMAKLGASSMTQTPDVITQTQRHYNPKEDVVGRAEFMPERQFKMMVGVVWSVEMLGIAWLVAEIILKSVAADGVFFRHPIVQSMNLAVGCVCWVGLSLALFFFVRRMDQARRSGKRWSQRRFRHMMRVGIELVVTYVTVCSFVAGNIYAVARTCSWFSPFVIAMGVLQWTGWSTLFMLVWVHAHECRPWLDKHGNSMGGRPDAGVMDAPVSIHAPKLIPWLIIEGLLIAAGVLEGRQARSISYDATGDVANCKLATYRCRPDKAVTILYSLLVVVLAVYFAGAFYNVRQAFRAYRALPYLEHRQINRHLRMQTRLDGLVMAFFAVCVVCLLFVSYAKCSNYLLSWLGFLPMMLVASGIAAANSYAFMPVTRQGDETLNIWLQEFAWTEDALPMRKAERGSSLGAESAAKLAEEPMFCFETSLKLLYWTRLIYKIEEDENTNINLETAMGLYSLTDFELLWERSTDTKCLMAWNEKTHVGVLAFRGTASLSNAIADIQAWYAVHPPKRGSWWKGTRPYAHRGFLRTWVANGLNKNIVDRMQRAVERMQDSPGKVKLYVTGHSLGGALATLAALEVRMAIPDHTKLDISCYTFGAPRTGNHAFAREYNKAVPDTWGVINDQDAVVRGGKLIRMYKRPGHRVIINTDGDLIVRPMFVEASIQRVPGGSAVSHHVLTAYQRSYVAVMKSQFSAKGVQGGREGILRLGALGTLERVNIAGLDADELQVLAKEGWDNAMMRRCRLAFFGKASKVSFGRFSSRSSGSVASSVGSSIDADSDGKDDKLEASLPSTTTEEAAGTDRSANNITRPAEAADREALGPTANLDVEARLAAGGDARADTGEPLGAKPEGQPHGTEAGVLSMLDTGKGKTVPELGLQRSREHGALTADTLTALRASAVADQALVDSRESDSRHPRTSHSLRGLQSAGSAAAIDSGTLLTSKNLARMDAEATAADVSGLQSVQGQLDGCGRCRIMSKFTS